MITYEPVTKCPVCGMKGDFWPRTTSVGPEFYTPFGFYAAYVSKYFECPVCSLWFQNPQPQMGDFYSSGEYRQMVKIPENQENNHGDEQRAEDSLRILKDAKLGGSLLDVGCGQGFLLERASAHFASCVGVEPDPEIAHTSQRTVRRLEDVKGQFDVVVASHVIEHVPQPVEFMKALKQFVVPGGALLLRVPVQTPLLASPLRPPHLVVFNYASFTTALTMAGMRAMRTEIIKDLAVLCEVTA